MNKNSLLRLTVTIFACLLSSMQTHADEPQQKWCQFEGPQEHRNGKHIVLIAGDEEYRSEETMPMLGKILAIRHGFKCTVLFPIDPETGTIDPENQNNIPGMEHLDTADLVILGLRFRELPDDQMKHFVDYVESGKPIAAFRTSTHAFAYDEDSDSKYKHYHWRDKSWPGGFGQQVLGETWVAHHGKHKSESCRGVVVTDQANHPILSGVKTIWGPSDVYTVKNLPNSANVLVNGQVLDGMSADSQPVDGKKNDPMMPIAWTKKYQTQSGKQARVFCTTMGASTDFESEGLRRMLVNASFWCMGMEDSIPESANVDYVDPFKPTPFGFGTFVKNMRPSDFNLKQKTGSSKK